MGDEEGGRLSASAVIGALKARLVAAGHTVTLLRTIDAEFDDLPLVGVHFGEDGEASELDARSPIPKHTLHLDIVRVQEASSNDPEIEAIAAAEALKAVLVQQRPDKPDDLDGSCHWAEIVQMTVDTRSETSDAIVSSVRVRAHY